MKGIAILAWQLGFLRIQADPQHVIDLPKKGRTDLHASVDNARAAIKSATDGQ